MTARKVHCVLSNIMYVLSIFDSYECVLCIEQHYLCAVNFFCC